MNILDQIKALINNDEQAEPIAEEASNERITGTQTPQKPLAEAQPIEPTTQVENPVISSDMAQELQRQLNEQAEAMKLLAQRPEGQTATAVAASQEPPRRSDMNAMTKRFEQEFKDDPHCLDNFKWRNPNAWSRQ